MSNNVMYFEPDLNEKIKDFFYGHIIYYPMPDTSKFNDDWVEFMEPGWKYEQDEEEKRYIIPYKNVGFNPEDMRPPLRIPTEPGEAISIKWEFYMRRFRRGFFYEGKRGPYYKAATYFDWKTRKMRYWYPIGKERPEYTGEKKRPTATYKSWPWPTPDSPRYGIYLIWHPNGQMAHYSKNRDGKMHGESKNWDENGNLIEQEFYVNGHKINGIKTTMQWLHRQTALGNLVKLLKSNQK